MVVSLSKCIGYSYGTANTIKWTNYILDVTYPSLGLADTTLSIIGIITSIDIYLS